MGAAVKVTRDDMTAGDLRKASGRVKDGKVARRLLAIALVLEGVSRKVAAESCGMDRQTVRDWVHRYNAEGLEGLSNRGGGGVKPRLSVDQMAQLSAWVEAGPSPERDGVVRWRRADLARRIEAEFDIKLQERTVGTYLAKLGFRRLTIRPEHPKADAEAQAAFKKNFRSIAAETLPEHAKKKPLEVWFQDEARVGQQGNSDPHLGSPWDPSARAARHAIQMELHLRRGLPGTRHGRRPDPASRRCRGNEPASTRNRQNRCDRRTCAPDHGWCRMASGQIARCA